MSRQRLLTDSWPVLDLGLTMEDLMRDLDPGWDSAAWTSPGAAADVAALLAALS